MGRDLRLTITVVLSLPNAVTLQYSSLCCGDPQIIKLFLLLLPNSVTLQYSSLCCGDPQIIKLFLLLLPNYNFAVMNLNVTIYAF